MIRLRARFHIPAVGVAVFAVLFAMAGRAPAQVNPYNTIGLEWIAGGDDGDVGRATRYEMRYRTSPPSTDTTSWWSGASAVSGLPFPSYSGSWDSVRVANLVPGTTYYFVLRAVDDGGLVSPFVGASAATDTCDAPTAAPGSFDVIEDTGDALLTWSGPPDPLAISLHIYRGQGISGGMSLLATIEDLAQTSYRDTGALAGTMYRYQIAWASDCADGPPTAPVTLTLSGTPPGPGASTGGSLSVAPNPANERVTVTVRVAGSGPAAARIRLFDLTGHLIADLVNETLTPGDHAVVWDRRSRSGGRVAPGYYELIGTIGLARVRERLVLLP